MFEVKSRVEKELLTYFFLNKSKRHHVHELARILDVDPANLNVKLRKLRGEGLFESEKRGNQTLYSINKSFPLFNEYQSIFNKKYGFEWELKHALMKIPGVKKAFIFGSYLWHRFDAYSDIDLLVVGHHDGLELSAVLSRLESKTGREINPVEMSAEDFDNRMNAKDPFLKHIFEKHDHYIELIV